MDQEIRKKVKSIILELEEMVLFQLSLSSRELFHSNFLLWLLTTYPNDYSPIFSRYLENTSKGNFHIEKVSREEKNIDLTIVFSDDEGNKKRLYIENKVKSLPYVEQLKKYEEKLSSGTFLLLTLAEPSSDITEYEPWNVMRYNELAEAIGNANCKFKNAYHEQTVVEYSRFITLLHELSVAIMSEEFNVYNIYDQDSLIGQLKSLRIDDLFIKLKHQDIVRRLENKVEINRELAPLLADGSIVIKQDFTRGTGISDVRYWFGLGGEEPFCLAVQLQEMNFRLMVEIPNRSAKPLAKSLLKNNLWFNFDLMSRSLLPDEITIYPKKKNKDFNQYTNKHLYKSVKIKNDCLVDDIIDTIYNYLLFINEHSGEFTKLTTKK